jgi:hypothetical protein
MTTPTAERIRSFRAPFTLSTLDGGLPAGSYRLVIDEEEIPGLSFVAFRRTATMLHTPALSATGGRNQVFVVDPIELSAAHDADRRGEPAAAPQK